jgi:hypothetical protein
MKGHDMNACESYEIHISALLDGEATQADMLLVLDHLPHCDPCETFYQQARELQDLVDAGPLAPGATVATELRAQSLGVAFLLQNAAAGDDLDTPTDDVETARGTVERSASVVPMESVVSMEHVPRWVWGLAASLLIALGFGLGTVGEPFSNGGSLQPGDLQIEIAADAGQMTDERFVALAVELLQSDRKYHQQMSAVLREVQDGRMAEGGGGEVAAWNDESSFSARSEDGGVGGMSELLRLSPTQDMY